MAGLRAEQRCRRWLERWHAPRPDCVVPVIGSGVTIQAARSANRASADDWAGLLRRILERSNHGRSPEQWAESLPEPFIQRWESIVRWCAMQSPNQHAAAAESTLQRTVMLHLRAIEQAGNIEPLYRTIINSGFRDIISLNFDRRLALAGRSERFHIGPKGVPIDAASLYRHSVVRTEHGRSRIWYPHGDTRRFGTIKLGIRKYGLYIRTFEPIRQRYMAAWKAFLADGNAIGRASPRTMSRSSPGLRPPGATPLSWDDTIRSLEPTSWAAIMLSAPLIFIGCGLSTDEWPLWWLLHQRARQMTFFDHHRLDYPRVLVLSAGPADRVRHLRGQPAQIEHVHFDSYDRLWDVLLDALFIDRTERTERS
ncbi:MAG: hypothetical protein KC983_03045 [Phycisphaerales bacterium]|nr:hypothetical protein [Phycisphaerales bacterium]